MFDARLCDIYSRFYNIFNKQLLSEHKQQLVPFVAAKGKSYPTQSMRLLLIGRAVNGWTSFETLPTDNARAFGEKALQEHRKDIFEDWLELKNGVLWSKHSADYSLNRSAFWRTARAIWSELSGQSPEGRWMNNIAWSNLYKISPKVSGNPSNTLCALQADLCRELLTEEIATFDPTHILLVTGWDGWFFHRKKVYDFSQLFTDVQKTDAQGEIVTGTAFFQLPQGRKTPAVITCRPEAKNAKLFTQKTVLAFRELESQLQLPS